MDDRPASFEDDFDPMSAFEPSPSPGAPAPEPLPWEGAGIGPEPDAGEAAGLSGYPDPAPPAPRPTVSYVGHGGDRAYVLLYPVRIGDRELRRVIVRHPALWDVQDWIEGRIKTNFEMMARMTAMTPVDLGALKWPDAEAVLAIVNSMLPAFIRDAIEAAATGGPPSGA